MKRRELFKAGAALGAAVSLPMPQSAAEMSPWLAQQGYKDPMKELPAEGVQIGITRFDGPLGLFMGDAMFVSGAFYIRDYANGGEFTIPTNAPNGWRYGSAGITVDLSKNKRVDFTGEDAVFL